MDHLRYNLDLRGWAMPVLVRPTLFERLLVRIAPGWVARRLAARQALLSASPAPDVPPPEELGPGVRWAKAQPDAWPVLRADRRGRALPTLAPSSMTAGDPLAWSSFWTPAPRR